MTHEQQETILRLHNEGKSLRQIAQAVGCAHPMQVLRVLRTVPDYKPPAKKATDSPALVEARQALKHYEERVIRLRLRITKLESKQQTTVTNVS
jgi:hypothetical protein